MAFTFSTARVLFGPGTRLQIAAQAYRLGRRCLLVTGSRPEGCAWFADDLSGVMDDVFVMPAGSESPKPHPLPR